MLLVKNLVQKKLNSWTADVKCECNSICQQQQQQQEQGLAGTASPITESFEAGVAIGRIWFVQSKEHISADAETVKAIQARHIKFS